MKLYKVQTDSRSVHVLAEHPTEAQEKVEKFLSANPGDETLSMFESTTIRTIDMVADSNPKNVELDDHLLL